MSNLHARSQSQVLHEEAAGWRLIVRFENDLTALIDPERDDDSILEEIISKMSPEEVLDGAKWTLERLPGSCSSRAALGRAG